MLKIYILFSIIIDVNYESISLRIIKNILFGQNSQCTPDTYQYNLIPKSENNYNYSIGGTGGEQFSSQYYLDTVSKIEAFWKNNSIIRIVLTYWNEKIDSYGSDDKGSSNVVFEFEKGETLKGYMEVYTYTEKEDSLNVSFIRFKTSLGKVFEAGDRDNIENKYEKDRFLVENSYLAGFFGAYTRIIKRLGVILWKPIIRAKIINIDYFESINFFKGAYITITNTLGTLCNDSDEEVTESFGLDRNKGYIRNINLEYPFITESVIELEASLPKIVKINKFFVWGPSPITKGKANDGYLDTHIKFIPKNVPPKTVVYAEYKYAEGFIKNFRLPIKLKIEFADETDCDLDLVGKLNLTTNTEVSADYGQLKLRDHERCIK